MLSEEFKSAVSSKNLLRVRIMLKDSLIIDPSFKLFDEMLYFSQSNGLQELVVAFDGESLEDNPSKWDKDLMDLEMVQIINNFSKERIEHLKKIVSKVYENKIQNMNKENLNRNSASNQNYPKSKPITQKQNNVKESNRIEALREITRNAKKIAMLLDETRINGKHAWDLKRINYMEEYALKIIKSIDKYKNNIEV